jgi:hypothetical protein
LPTVHHATNRLTISLNLDAILNSSGEFATLQPYHTLARQQIPPIAHLKENGVHQFHAFTNLIYDSRRQVSARLTLTARNL